MIPEHEVLSKDSHTVLLFKKSSTLRHLITETYIYHWGMRLWVLKFCLTLVLVWWSHVERKTGTDKEGIVCVCVLYKWVSAFIHTSMHKCTWKPEKDERVFYCFPPYCSETGSLADLEAHHLLARQAGHETLKICLSPSSSSRVAGTHNHTPLFTPMLGIQTQVLIFADKVFLLTGPWSCLKIACISHTLYLEQSHPEWTQMLVHMWNPWCSREVCALVMLQYSFSNSLLLSPKSPRCPYLLNHTLSLSCIIN